VTSDVRVLICDDYAPMRSLLRAIIDERPGMAAVGDAADGNEAIAEATRLQPDVILLDLAMPRKTGLQALQEIGRIAPMARIVIFSGFSIASVGKDVMGLGAVSYLQKGASPDAIADAIETAATGVAPVAQRAAVRTRGSD
jgi:NarL family two-component system response regulator LiaR